MRVHTPQLLYIHEYNLALTRWRRCCCCRQNHHWTDTVLINEAIVLSGAINYCGIINFSPRRAEWELPDACAEYKCLWVEILIAAWWTLYTHSANLDNGPAVPSFRGHLSTGFSLLPVCLFLNYTNHNVKKKKLHTQNADHEKKLRIM